MAEGHSGLLLRARGKWRSRSYSEAAVKYHYVHSQVMLEVFSCRFLVDFLIAIWDQLGFLPSFALCSANTEI